MESNTLIINWYINQFTYLKFDTSLLSDCDLMVYLNQLCLQLEEELEAEKKREENVEKKAQKKGIKQLAKQCVKGKHSQYKARNHMRLWRIIDQLGFEVFVD